MKKISEMTMAEMLAELNTSVNTYNASNDAAERVELSATHADLVKAYNEASILSAYATCMKDKKPVVALAKMLYCAKVSTKDTPHKVTDETGKTTVKITRSVNEGVQKLNVVKFLDWAAERNQCLAASKDWKAKMYAARDTINSEWKKWLDSTDGTKMSKNAIKKKLQAMFDAIAFIPCDNDAEKNAIIANNNSAGWIVALAATGKTTNDNGKVTMTLEFLKGNKLNDLVTDILHMAIEGKTFDVVYGDPEEEAKAAAVKTTKAAEANTEEAAK